MGASSPAPAPTGRCAFGARSATDCRVRPQITFRPTHGPSHSRQTVLSWQPAGPEGLFCLSCNNQDNKKDTIDGRWLTKCLLCVKKRSAQSKANCNVPASIQGNRVNNQDGNARSCGVVAALGRRTPTSVNIDRPAAPHRNAFVRQTKAWMTGRHDREGPITMGRSLRALRVALRALRRKPLHEPGTGPPVANLCGAKPTRQQVKPAAFAVSLPKPLLLMTTGLKA